MSQIIKPESPEPFQIKGRGPVFIVNGKDNPGVDLSDLCSRDVQIDGKLYHVTALECSSKNGKWVDSVGLVVRSI